jgi:hypothetical protein
MVNKKFWLGILTMPLIFGVCVAGCTSTPPNFYELGNVSEENCTFIQVARINDLGSDFQIIDLVKIDGQGDANQWQRPRSLNDGLPRWTQAIVRVTPGEHIFTISFISVIADGLSDQTNSREVPASITYNCVAGKGYDFTFSAKSNDPGNPFASVTTEITIWETEVDEKGNFKILNTKEVAKKTETLRIPVTGSDVEGFYGTVVN